MKKSRILEVETRMSFDVTTLDISRETLELFRERALAHAQSIGGEFLDTAIAKPDGRFAIPLADDVALTLELIRSPGMTDDDLIRLILSPEFQFYTFKRQ